jgi:hypothetical protein
VTSTTTVVNDEGQPVTLVHRGEDALAVLPDLIPVGDTVFGHATVVYGFQVEAAGRERFVPIPQQEVGGYGSPSADGAAPVGE